MAKYCVIPAVVEVIQWFKNGDHPKDACEVIHGVGGEGEILTEGKVVRYYRTPIQDGHEECALCGSIMHKHGWIDVGLNGHLVCPGDWIITDDRVNDPHSPDYRYPVKPDVFTLRFTAVSSSHQFEETSGLADIRERVANLCHEQWSGWMKYLFGKCEEEVLTHTYVLASERKTIIPKEFVDRWKRQMATPYGKLFPKEQDSDHTEADKFLSVFLDILKSQPTIYQDELREALEDVVTQFGYDGSDDKGPYLFTGGLSTLELAFRVLDWGDKHYIPEQKCQVVGCNKRATCGYPTPDGYTRVCSEHHRDAAGAG